ncbi:MAG: hypothetical protein WDZ94_02840 [Patescibacteria group bacterium]
MRTLLYHPIAVILILLVAVLFYISLDQSARKAEVSTKNVELLQQEITQMTSDVSQLEKDLEDNDLSFTQEQILRNELRQKKEGEVVFQVPDFEIPELPPEPTPEPKTPWQEWREIVW